MTLRSSGELGKYPARWGQLLGTKIAKWDAPNPAVDGLHCSDQGNQLEVSAGLIEYVVLLQV